jgi:hypothetical protein
MTVQLIDDQVITDYLQELGHNSNNFRLVNLHTFTDSMNSRQFDYVGVQQHVVPASIAENATMIGYDFSCTDIEMYNEQDELLGSTAGLGFSDLGAPTAFAVDDLYVYLGIKKWVDEKLVLVRSPVRDYAMQLKS